MSKTEAPLLGAETNNEANQATPGEPAKADTQDAPTEQTEEGKTEGTEPSESKAGDKADDVKEGETEGSNEPEGAPESYEPFKVPEGLPEDSLSDKVIEPFSKVARELNLSQDKAQSLIDAVMPAMHQQAVAEQHETHQQWVREVKSDKEIGGDKLDDSLAAAKRAVQVYGDESVQELLNGPLGSHPGLVKLLVKAGKTVSEDAFVGGKPNAERSIDPQDDAAVAKRLYPTSA